ncbi:LLM class flavin-dependent oxidoreductase [Saccharomonospora sp. NPDC006951]
MRIGVVLPPCGADGTASVASQARHAESCGLESVWKGDHLITSGPVLDSVVVLTAAATATERLKVGFAVLVVALRPVALIAKQVATLQLLSRERVLLGVGIGDSAHGDAGWRAVGRGLAGRGRLTDAALEVLPNLVAGKSAVVAAEPVRLAPSATMPPLLVGGNSAAAVRRSAWYGDEWFPAFPTTKAVRAGARTLSRFADSIGRPVPGITAGVCAALGNVPAATVDRQARALSRYGGEKEMRDALAAGRPSKVAERFAAFEEAGVSRIVVTPFGGEWYRQVELLGEVADHFA